MESRSSAINVVLVLYTLLALSGGFPLGFSPLDVVRSALRHNDIRFDQKSQSGTADLSVHQGHMHKGDRLIRKTSHFNPNLSDSSFEQTLQPKLESMQQTAPISTQSDSFYTVSRREQSENLRAMQNSVPPSLEPSGSLDENSRDDYTATEINLINGSDLAVVTPADPRAIKSGSRDQKPGSSSRSLFLFMVKNYPKFQNSRNLPMYGFIG